MPDFTIALPEIFLAIAAMILLIFGVFRGNESTRAVSWLSILSMLLCGLLVFGNSWDSNITFNNLFIMDGFAGFLKILILAGSAASLLISVEFLYRQGIARFEYPVLVLTATLGMMLMVSANDLLSLYVALELQSLSLYVLAAIQRDTSRASEAGLKYFILGALSSGMLLFGASLVYGYAGSTNFSAIADTLSGTGAIAPGVIVGLVFVLAGLAFKVSAVPFHMWTPDVYEGAPLSVTALFAIVPKIAAMGLLMRLLVDAFGPVTSEWQQIIAFLSVASMIVGAFAALVQDNIKRLLAYSSIGNMGYALIGILAGHSDGFAATLVYLSIYAVMTAGTFGILLSIHKGGTTAEKITDLSGLSQKRPHLAYALAILMFSMSGIPPMAGFFGKLLIFQSAISTGMYSIAVIGVLTSVVAAYYYLRIIKVMFFDEANEELDIDIAFEKRVFLFTVLAFILCFVVAPSFLIDQAQAAANALYAF